MKKILLVLNPLIPFKDHNSNLVLRILPHINSKPQIVSLNVNPIKWPISYEKNRKSFPKEIEGFPIRFAKNYKAIDKFLSFVFNRLFSNDFATVLLLTLKTYCNAFFRAYKSDIIFSSHESYFSSLAASLLRKKTPKALYLMDPTRIMHTEGTTVKDESKHFLNMIRRYDVIFTTPFIKEAMISKGYSSFTKKIVEVSFPGVIGFNKKSQRTEDKKIQLLFSGRLYLGTSIRSPEYFLNLISRLDNRFKVVFVGHEAPSLLNAHPIKTEAEIELLPQMEDQNSLQQLIADSDVLINIGNSLPVHIPSKTFEYINTGKPIVNFYKFDKCPTLHYLKSHPLCLNLSENDNDVDKVASEFINFCLNSKGKELQQSWIKENFYECTPQFIGKTINDTLNQILEEKNK